MTARPKGRKLAIMAVASALTALVALALGARSAQSGGAFADDDWARPAVVAGGLVFVSAVHGAGPDLASEPADVGAETRRALERMSDVLESAGSSLSQLATVNVYLRRASDFAAMNEAYAPFFPDDPPTRTTIVSDLSANRLVAMSAVAVPTGGLREALHPAGWVKSQRPYSYIVRTEHLVFFSGLVSRRGVDDRLMPGPISTQMKTVFDNARVLLRTAGLQFRDVVAAKVFITDELHFVDMNAAYRRVFNVEPPARATAVVPLMSDEANVEMTFVASRSGREVFGPTVSPSVPLSAAVTAGPFVFLSGVLGNTEANLDDPRAQAREALTRIGRTLETAGTSIADVVDNVIYVTHLADAAGIDQVYREFFPAEPPARTTVGAGLVAPTGLVEVMTTAVRRVN